MKFRRKFLIHFECYLDLLIGSFSWTFFSTLTCIFRRVVHISCCPFLVRVTLFVIGLISDNQTTGGELTALHTSCWLFSNRTFRSQRPESGEKRVQRAKNFTRKLKKKQVFEITRFLLQKWTKKQTLDVASEHESETTCFSANPWSTSASKPLMVTLLHDTVGDI